MLKSSINFEKELLLVIQMTQILNPWNETIKSKFSNKCLDVKFLENQLKTKFSENEVIKEM